MWIPPGYANCILPVQNTATTGSNPVVTFGIEIQVGGDLNALPDRVWTVFADSILPLLDNTRTWGPITCQLGNSPGPPLSITGDQSAVGGATISSVPPNTAVLVQKRTTLGGKEGRGRYFWPFAADRSGVTEGGVWDSLANFQVAQEDFLGGLQAEDLPMVLLHAGAEPAPTTVVALLAQNPLATVRRRLRR